MFIVPRRVICCAVVAAYLILATAACSSLPDQTVPTLPVVGVVQPSATLGPTSVAPVPSDTPAANPTTAATATQIAAIQPAPSETATRTLAEAVTTTVQVSTTATLTETASSASCFGSIHGRVIADLDANHQADAGDPGLEGATLFLKSGTGIVGVYTTGNGEFNFPGLVIGRYSLSETPPGGYQAEDPAAAELDVTCGASVTKDFLNVPIPATQTPTPTATLTPVLPTPRPLANSNPPRGSGGAFVPFDGGPRTYIGGCGSISAPGTYLLTNNLNSRWDCLQVFSDDVVLDCQNYTLEGVDGNGYGVVVHHTSLLLGRPVRNIEIRNCNATAHRYGIFVDAADNLYIHDNNTSGNYTDTDKRNFGIFLGLVEGGGIRVNDTRGGLISDNHADNQAIGIDLRKSRQVVVRDNMTNGNTAWGIQLYGVNDSVVEGNTSTNNIRYCTWGSGVVGPGCDAGGIMLQGGSNNNLVKNNTISGSNGNGIFIKAHGEPCGDSNTIANNRIIGAMYNAIELSFCSDNRIQGNEISGSLDGIWMGFATQTEVDADNYLHDLSNHGIISWNSQGNNISTNRIINSREALYFYSSDYNKQDFYFVSGAPSDHVSRGNCLCSNEVSYNSAAAIHFNNSIKNQVTGNTLTGNGANFILEGNSSGNIIENNVIKGAYLGPPFERASSVAQLPKALELYDANGQPLTWAETVHTLTFDPDGEPFDLRWFKYKLRASLGLTYPPGVRTLAASDLLALFGFD